MSEGSSAVEHVARLGTAHQESPGLGRARFAFVFVAFLVLIGLAHGGAELKASLPASHPGPSVVYYRTLFVYWVATILLTLALCFYLFSRRGSPNSYWRAFWTFGYLAYMCHLGWTMVGTVHGDRSATPEGTVALGNAVSRLGPDLTLAVWWGLDVFLAGVISSDRKWVQIQRGFLHLFAFAMCFGATLLAARANWATRTLGVVMALAVLLCFVLRLIVRESDPHSLLHVLYVKGFQFLNFFVRWDKLPTFLAVTNLGAIREVLRARNLHNTSDIPVTNPTGVSPIVPFQADYLGEREEDGQYNDLSKPTMGNASTNPANPLNSSEFTLSNPGARFGRNIPLSEIDPTHDGGILDPSPRLVSNRLLARPTKNDGTSDFKPATILNLLAAAWIQFQTHDWFNHGAPRPIDDDPFDIPLEPGDPWPGGKMLVRRTRSDPTRRPNDSVGPATFVNAETHWWDSSQIYGDSPQAGKMYRSSRDGKLKIDPETRRIPVNPTGVEATGLTSNWWLGLSLLHNLFTLEHNAICDHLKLAFPDWSDEQLFRAARLANNALMAKIHTVDWTPAILTHPALRVAMNANWWGLATEKVKKLLGRVSASEAVSGIPGSETGQHGADYCLTEEFTSVYRLHPLLPNDIPTLSFKNRQSGRVLKFESEDPQDPDLIVGPNAMANALRDGTSVTDLFYTFGVHNPGALTLRNFPNWMRKMRRGNGQNLEELIDLATIDILRDRERGVPRYNRFRELFHLPRVWSFEQMTDDPTLAAELRAVYGHPDKVDLMVGMYAEKPPEGFGFSDTAFRVFILMASRRLKSDRFFTRDYTPAVYTQPGLDWVENNNMTTALLRHFPELSPILQRTANAFAPWPTVKQLAASQ